MIKQIVSIFVIASIACLVGLSLKKADYLKTLYQELTTPQKWRRVEIVDEKSLFEELVRDYIWEYLEVLVVGFTACIFSFTIIGWSANTMRRGSADSGDEDVPAECLGEQCALYEQVEEVEEIVKEFEQSGDRLSSRNVSNIELKLSESETMNKACRSDCNDSCQETEEDTTTSLNCLTIEKEKAEQAICKVDIKSETCDNLIITEVFKTWRLPVKKFENSNHYYRVETDDLFDESPKPLVRDSHEVSDERKFTYSKVITSLSRPKKVTTMDDFGSCKSRNDKSNHVGGQVREAVVETDFNINKSRSTKMEVLEALRNEHGDSYLSSCIPPNQEKPENSFRCTKTESSLDDRTKNKSKVNVNLTKVDDTNLEKDLNKSKNFTTKPDEGRVEVDKFSKLDVAPSTMTVFVDGAGPDRDPARSANWRNPSHRIDSRGRIPQYQNLHKEIKPDPKTPKSNKKNNMTKRTSKAPHQYIDELSKDVLSTQQSSSERQNRPSTAAGDNLHATESQRRKKNLKYHAQNSSYKTDSNNC